MIDAGWRPSPPADDEVVARAQRWAAARTDANLSANPSDWDAHDFARALLAERAAREAAEARAHNGRLAVAEERKLATAAEAEVAQLREALEKARAEVKLVIRTLELLNGPCSNADRALAILAAALAPAAPEEADGR